MESASTHGLCNRRLCASVVLVALSASVPLLAQSPAARPAFDVASVKLDTGSGQRSSRATADQITFTNQTLKQLVVIAYRVLPFQVEAPDWTESVRFDITAKYPLGTNDEDRMAMLRMLLEDRFHLAVHHESKQVSGYALVIAKGGFKLQPAEPGEGTVSENSQGSVAFLRATKTDMSVLAYYLGDYLGEAVVDQTGLKGVYDFQLRCANDSAGASAEPLPSLFTALQETLGLNLQRQKVPVDIIVIDHADRTPVEN
jgi:uncharacterized protein (TIGR03435 family)